MHAAVLLLASFPALSAVPDDLPKPVRITTKVSGHIHPAACVTKRGVILVSFCQSDFRDLRMSRSTDGGKTWSEPEPFALTVKTSLYPGSLTTLKDGRVVHAWNVWFPIKKKNGKNDKSRYVAYSISADEGKTWGPIKTLPKNEDETIHSVIRHPLVEVGPEAWVLPLSDRTVVYDPKTEESKPFGDGRNHDLVPLVHTPKGTWISGAGLRSTDDGKTWQKITPFPNIKEQGWRHEMMGLSNGWLLASDIEGPGVGGNLIRAIVSRDDGQSWDMAHPLEYYNPGRPIGGRACPRTVQLDEQTLGTVFYDGANLYFLRIPISLLGSR